MVLQSKCLGIYIYLLRITLNLLYDIFRIQWISDFTILVSTLQGNVFAYDARTGQRKFSLSGHLAEVYSFSFDPRLSLLLTVSEDTSAKIFEVPELGD